MDSRSMITCKLEEAILKKTTQNTPKQTSPQLHKDDGTKLLEMHRSLSKAQEELDRKRKEVEERKKALGVKWFTFEKRKAAFKEQVERYIDVINEGENMRQKAMQRAANEVKKCKQKEIEIEELKRESDGLKIRCREKTLQVKMNKQVQEFLEAAHRRAPDGYFDRNMSRATSVVNRYKSQWSNKQYLEHRMATNTDTIMKTQLEMKRKTEQFQRYQAVTYTKISELTKKLERLKHKNIMLDEKCHRKQLNDHERNEELYSIVMAVENLSTICEKHMSKLKVKKSISNNPIVSKVNQIEDFLIHKSAVVEHGKMLVKNEMERMVSGTGVTDKVTTSAILTRPTGSALSKASTRKFSKEV